VSSEPAHPDGFDEVIHEFAAEAGEILSRIEQALVALERTPDDPELLAGIFRGFHTIKGNSSFLGFPRTQETAHAAEALLAGLRDRRTRPSAAAVSALLQAIDVVRKLIAPVESTGAEAAADPSALVKRLGELAAAPVDETPEPAEPASEVETNVRSAAESTVRVDVDLLDRLMNLVG
jgi:two-component system, chemotaxis family, sensor kinase CheA